MAREFSANASAPSRGEFHESVKDWETLARPGLHAVCPLHTSLRHAEQKMRPQDRQWCRRTSTENVLRQLWQVRAELSGIHRTLASLDGADATDAASAPSASSAAGGGAGVGTAG